VYTTRRRYSAPSAQHQCRVVYKAGSLSPLRDLLSDAAESREAGPWLMDGLHGAQQRFLQTHVRGVLLMQPPDTYAGRDERQKMSSRCFWMICRGYGDCPIVTQNLDSLIGRGLPDPVPKKSEVAGSLDRISAGFAPPEYKRSGTWHLSCYREHCAQHKDVADAVLRRATMMMDSWSGGGQLFCCGSVGN
jgi:hypothetical protein